MNVLVATLSYLPDDLSNLEKRMSYHAQQLRWLESLGLDFEYLRVESAWGEAARSNPELVPKLNYKALVRGPQPCGLNRTNILEYFYETDYDWLMCLDDDRMLYPHYSPRNFIRDLNTPDFKKLAEEGHLIVCLDPIYMPFKKENYAWEHHETHWHFRTEVPHGCLQVCFIPNLKKFGFPEIYFDRVTRAQMNEAPEDLKFEVDWLKEKHPIIKCNNLIMKEIGQQSGNGSTIYIDLEGRRAIEATQGKWLSDYLHELFPRNPKLWNLKELNRRRNPTFTRLVPRSERHVFTGGELPKE